MASTFSPTLRIELIGDGDQSGIWGQTTNSNLGTLIEQAITGVQNITMLDANYTLSSFNGVADEARNGVLVVAGTLTVQRNLVAPLVEKTYTIKNSTTGGFGIQIVGASGTGVVIPNGQTIPVYCDGTNFYPLLTGTAGNFRVTGTLTVTGTTALTGALTATTATFSGAISSVSPSFTGVPTAPTAAGGTNTTQIATTAFVTTVVNTLGTMSTQNANAVAITGGAINGTTIGAVTASTVRGTTGTFTGALSATTGTFSGAVSGLSFAGAGTGLTGTAASLSIGGNAATATNATNVTGTIASAVTATTQAVATNNTTVATTAFVRSIIPAGVILLWSGSVAAVPTGWYLCNGANGTPNLQDRFIVGAGSAYAVGATGGSADATLVSHTHSLSASGTTSTADVSHTHSGTTGTESVGHTHTYSATTSSSGTHTHTVPYNLFGVNSGGTNALATGTGSSYYAGNSNIPTAGAHTHTVSGTTAGISANHTHAFATGAMSANSTHSHTVTVTGTSGSAGSSATGANLPPYYALCYIMKA